MPGHEELQGTYVSLPTHPPTHPWTPAAHSNRLVLLHPPTHPPIHPKVIVETPFLIMVLSSYYPSIQQPPLSLPPTHLGPFLPTD